MIPALTPESWDEIAPARNVWLITLADLALLLIGFFVLLQANRATDRATLLEGMRAGFGIEAPAMPDPMAVGRARIDGFAPGSTRVDVRAAIDWARDVARDPRIRITVSGSTDPHGDVDAETGSAAILAADRARFVATALVADGAVSPDRLTLEVAPGSRRAVTLSAGFVGESQIQSGDTP